MVTFLAALACIILGFVVGIFNVDIVFGPGYWLLAAIAINTLNVVLPSIAQRRAAP